jgi:hypothetical protein
MLGSGIAVGGTGVDVGMAAAVWVIPATTVAAAWVWIAFTSVVGAGVADGAQALIEIVKMTIKLVKRDVRVKGVFIILPFEAIILLLVIYVDTNIQ